MTPRATALGGAALLAVTAVVALVAAGASDEGTTDAADAPAATAAVHRGPLAAAVTQDGVLAYRARPDGSPFAVTGHARGTYTALPEVGDEIRCGGVLLRVDDRPVLLLCGAIPAYRDLATGDAGRDVRQLNRTLGVRSAGDAFTAATAQALAALQRRTGAEVDGALALGEAVVLPGPVRIAKVGVQLGAPARPGAVALHATSRTLHVLVPLDAPAQGQVRRGDRALVTFPGNRTARGAVVAFGRIAADGSVPASIALDEPRRARGMDRAAVGVQIRTDGVDDALSVPVTALVGRAGGGFAVEAVRDGGERELVAVRVGLLDPTAGRVEVEGELREGDRVAVPSS